MFLHFAGFEPAWREQGEGRSILVSFDVPRQLALVDEGWKDTRILVDSGAFSAWKHGREVDLDAYIAWLKPRAHKIAGYFCLDRIPGTFANASAGIPPSAEEAIAATEETLRNLDTMRAAGLTPIPIFHEGEDMALLDRFVEEGNEVIGLGGTASRGTPALLDWLIPIFDRHPRQKFHGLAMTQFRIIKHCPFYSVDSSTWLYVVKFKNRIEERAFMYVDRSPEFYQWLGIPKFAIRRRIGELKGRDNAFFRELGIRLFEDLAKQACPPEVQATRDGQLAMFDVEVMKR